MFFVFRSQLYNLNWGCSKNNNTKTRTIRTYYLFPFCLFLFLWFCSHSFCLSPIYCSISLSIYLFSITSIITVSGQVQLPFCLCYNCVLFHTRVLSLSLLPMFYHLLRSLSISTSLISYKPFPISISLSLFLWFPLSFSTQTTAIAKFVLTFSRAPSLARASPHRPSFASKPQKQKLFVLLF